uniref:Serine carboxypeptidase-like protein 18 n=1 Tax=Aegilops tauschii TaxID=37682 RepID=R7W337_AEGTA
MDGRLLLLCFFFWTAVSTRQFAVAGAAFSSKVVTSLPGLPGRLPFHLETGYPCLAFFFSLFFRAPRRYVEVDEDNGTELFYFFVESEAGAEDAPFLLWLTGGDRCSVLSGLALEIGPFQFVPEPYNGTVPRLRINPYSWTKVQSCVDSVHLQVANILFVDTPVGAGFSFSRRPEGYDVGEVSTSLQLHELLIKWFTDHPKFLTNPLYLGGDSLAGHLVPFIAQKISEASSSSSIYRSIALNFLVFKELCISILISMDASGHLSASLEPPEKCCFSLLTPLWTILPHNVHWSKSFLSKSGQNPYFQAGSSDVALLLGSLARSIRAGTPGYCQRKREKSEITRAARSSMGKERSSGGAAALWVEKQIWEETDADEKEQASTSS